MLEEQGEAGHNKAMETKGWSMSSMHVVRWDLGPLISPCMAILSG